MDDPLGLDEDKWWERLLTRWERIPHGLKTTLVGGLMGAVVVAFFLLVNSWTTMPGG